MVFLENYFQLILMLHLLTTFFLIGSMTHNLLRVVDYARGRFNRRKQEQRFNSAMFWSYIIVYVQGCLIYPAFRVYMRRDYFDISLGWATGLFEVKEHWGALALAMIAFYYILRKSFDPGEEKDRCKLFLYVSLCFLINFIIWYKTIIGAYLSHLKGAF